MQCFEGVVGDNLYPVLIIDVFRNKDYEELVNAQNNLLGVRYKQDHEELQNFLREFLNFYKIEIPEVRFYAAGSAPICPSFYEIYRNEWGRSKEELVAKNSLEEELISDIDEKEFKENLQLDQSEKFVTELSENLKD